MLSIRLAEPARPQIAWMIRTAWSTAAAGGLAMLRMILALGPRASNWDRGGHGPQIIATSLRCASLSPSMYRWVVWIDR